MNRARQLQYASTRSPVVFVPGNGGNQMEVRVDRPPDPNDPCPTQLDWHRLWLDIWSLRSAKLECWTKKIEMEYDPTSGKSENLKGVYTRVTGWGDMDTVDYLDPSWSAYLLGNAGAYFQPMSKVMKRWGYKEGVDLRGAPYDWRKLPESQDFYNRLRLLVEDTYKKNNNKKVTLLAHSLGCRFVLLFLQKQPAAWKERYIHAFVAMGGPWGGSALEHILYASGWTMGIPLIDPTVIRREQRTSETNMLLLPTAAGFKPDQVIVQAPEKNYTVNDYDAFFDDIGYPVGKQRLKAMEHERTNLEAPGVKTYCLYGVGIPTPLKMIYKQRKLADKQPSIVYGDGDGTVNVESASLCSSWDNTIVKTFNNVYHEKMFVNTEIQNYIKTVVIH